MKYSVCKVKTSELQDGVFLAARGGGIRSCVAIGVLKALEEARIPVKGVCGESLSSIFAALLACGYDSKELMDTFLEYNSIITRASKLYGGRGSVVIEEEVNKKTNGTLIKDLTMPCYINACAGKLSKPELFIFSKYDTPDQTLGTACRASASLPIFFGNYEKEIDGKKYSFFDGGLLLNPFIPYTEDPVLLASFYNSIDYYELIPTLKRTLEPSYMASDIIINAPVHGIMVIGSNDDMKKAAEAGYEETKRVLKL